VVHPWRRWPDDIPEIEWPDPREFALSEAVADDSEMNLAQVQERQDEAYGAYLDATRWIAAIALKEGVDLSKTPLSCVWLCPFCASSRRLRARWPRPTASTSRRMGVRRAVNKRRLTQREAS
jgi:hypothetical protein